MRTMAVVVGGVGATALVVLLAFGGSRSQAQQTKPAADSIAATVISDTGSLKGPRQPIFFRHDIHAGKFKMRYSEFGFNDAAKLDDGSMWPIVYALTKLTKADEDKIAELVEQAVS